MVSGPDDWYSMNRARYFQFVLNLGISEDSILVIRNINKPWRGLESETRMSVEATRKLLAELSGTKATGLGDLLSQMFWAGYRVLRVEKQTIGVE